MPKNFLKNKRVLITSGPTWVPLDVMRVISNVSSGRMGHQLAKAFGKAQARVTLLEGPVHERMPPTRGVKAVPFRYFKDLQKLMRAEVKKAPDIIVHAAAVSDYRPARTDKGKIRSGQDDLRIDLVPTPKLITAIKRKAPKALLVGFKMEPRLTRTLARSKAQALFDEARCDWAVVNRLTPDGYQGYLVAHDGAMSRLMRSRQQMAGHLVERLKNL
jgi:phosphopantothenoylcysteine decarboxylase/phosphopantothenate--cysteine ligase